MKKCTRLLLAVTFVVLLASCGGSSPDEDAARSDASAEVSTPQPRATVVPETSAPEADAATSDTAADDEDRATSEDDEQNVAVEPTPRPTVAPIDPVIYDGDFGTSVAPIFATKCASCHNAGGPGASHWKLESAQDLVATHEWIAGVVDSRYMPPWPASDLSVAFHDNRGLRADEIDAIVQWSQDGAPLDVETTLAIAAPDGVVALDSDIELTPHESYQGSPEVADDYRCFIYDPQLEEARWIKGYEFVPDQTEIVHHAVGMLVQGRSMEAARALSAEDEAGGWQCYGGSRIAQDSLFLGWAPGQLPTIFPDGSGLKMNAGDFIVIQVHYHYDGEAPVDASTIRIDWAEGDDLDPITISDFVAPAEIPCTSEQEGPLCDRDAAIRRAISRYGFEGVQADGINQVCGARVEDFAEMTDGIASSQCLIPVRDWGEIVSVFGHEHEIGKSLRITLNPGLADQRILLDIPDWSFDWQYNYYPTESIMVGPGDRVLLECTWDRSREKPGIEPAYILWADGTNDEMCFATIAVRSVDPATQSNDESAEGLEADVSLGLPDDLAACLAESGVGLDAPPTREDIDTTVAELFSCAEPDEVGEILTDVIAENFGGLVDEDGIACLRTGMANPDGARDLLLFSLDDATREEREPIGNLVSSCVSLSSALEAFGLTMPESATACIDEAGRELLFEATIAGELPEEQAIFGAIGPCLAGS